MARPNIYLSLLFDAIKNKTKKMSDLVATISKATSITATAENKPAFHVVLCASKDIKGLLAANMADQFFSPKGIKVSILLSDSPPKHEGGRLAGVNFGPHEYDYWFGDGNREGYIDELDRKAEGMEARSSSDLKAYGTFNELNSKGVKVQVLEKKINNKANQEMLRDMQPDIIFSARFQQIFKPDTLEIPKYGILNIHPGALPNYRGLHVDMRAMMNHEENLTMTMHVIDTGIDTGKVLGEAVVPMNTESSLFMHRIKLHVGGMNMFFSEVMRLAALEGQADTRAPVDAEGTTTAPPTTASAAATSDAKASEAADKAMASTVPHNSNTAVAAEEGDYYTWPEENEYKKFSELGLIHCTDADIAFVKSLFDRRVPHSGGTIDQEPKTGLLVLEEE